MMPITFALLYVGTTFKGLSHITHGWNEVSTINWVFLLFGFGISVILIVLITRISKATLDNEETEHAHEMLPIVESKELNFPKLVTIRIDPLKEDLEQKLMVTV
ncbi:putative transmembrane protein TMEM64 [Lupinus albus]|uniref:Putative transmembrane protein TMEM64 n=1 Tax=Lupinus albus TaxID=3870 RepID=A0A6A4MQV2_LUPAL|nr:putative transmembrane protein TMEM64 [Lupinus albus]